jgi:hypothetical protein
LLRSSLQIDAPVSPVIMRLDSFRE